MERQFEEFELTHPTEQKDEFLAMIRVGNYKGNAICIPAMLPFEEMNGLCFETNQQTRADALRQMQYIALSLLKQVKPELLNITFVDIGIKNNFSMLHSLKEQYKIKFINDRDNLQREIEMISKKARDVSTYCSNLKEYNRETEHKEPYHILFIANFPNKFSEEEINSVSELISECANYGIYVVMNLDKEFYPEKDNYNQKRFAKLYALPTQMVYLDCTKLPKATLSNFNNKTLHDFFAKYNFEFETYPQDNVTELITTLNQSVEKQSKQPDNFLYVPIGRSGSKTIYLEMGQKAGVYHGFIAGQSGSGKTTLLNNIIATIAEQYSPDEMRLYLLDYKQGIEFQIFKNHPNVELLLLDNTNFKVGVKSLEKFNDEINKRAKLFLEYKARSIDEYNKKVLDKEKMPRMLMIIDEVQQLFIHDWEMNKRVNDLVKQIAKQGRAYGIHMLFSSQSYMDCKIADDTLSQMALRIAYSLANRKECWAILGSGNDAPTKLDISEYKAIYNSKNGDEEANITVKMDDFDIEIIESLLEKAAEKHKGCKPFEKKIYDGIEETIEIEQNDNNKNKYGKDYFGF